MCPMGLVLPLVTYSLNSQSKLMLQGSDLAVSWDNNIIAVLSDLWLRWVKWPIGLLSPTIGRAKAHCIHCLMVWFEYNIQNKQLPFSHVWMYVVRLFQNWCFCRSFTYIRNLFVLISGKVPTSKHLRYSWTSFENEAIEDFFQQEINDVTCEGNKGSIVGGMLSFEGHQSH